MDVSFAHPGWLWALLALPVLALIEWRAVARARRVLAMLVGERPDHALLAHRDPGERRVGMALRLAALALLALGAAGPEWGRETVRRSSSGSDIVLAIDVSASMEVRDVVPSRLDEARREALALLDRVEGSRVGVLAFAGDAVRLCPLTLDQAATRLVLQTVAPGSVSTPGTDLGRAFDRALAMLPVGRRSEQAIVLWTDGEDLEGHARASLEAVRRAGVRVYTVGVGTPAGDAIPVLNDQGEAVDVKRDEQGGVVRSQLDEKLLRDVARSTRGAYFSAARSGGEIARLAAAMGSLAHSRRGARLMERPVARFPYFAALAAALLIAEALRPRRRAVRAAGPAARALAAALVLAALCAPRAMAQSAWARGDAAFRAGAWARAESLYAQRAKRGAPAPVLVDLATSRAHLGKREDATRALAALATRSDASGQAAGYNLGTMQGEQKDYDKALAELRRALERNPDDADARWNYELLARERAAEKQRRQPQQQQPKSPEKAKPDGRGGAQQQPQPQPGGTPPAQAPQQPQRPQPSGAPTRMTKQQAEQLLGSLQELERLDRQRARPTQRTQERRGRDW